MKQFKLLSMVTNTKKLMIVSLISCFIQFSGLTLLTTYSTLIINRAFESCIDEYSGSLILGFTRLFANIFFMFIVDKVKRRSLYFTSFLVSTVCLAFLGIFYTFVLHNIEYSLFYTFWSFSDF